MSDSPTSEEGKQFFPVNIYINNAHFPVTVLGPGALGIWTQGCSIGCKGCVSRDTWPEDETEALGVDDRWPVERNGRRRSGWGHRQRWRTV